MVPRDNHNIPLQSLRAGEVSSVIIVFELASLWRCFWKHFHELFLKQFLKLISHSTQLSVDIWATAAFVAVTVMPSSTIKMFLIPLDSSVQKGVERKKRGENVARAPFRCALSINPCFEVDEKSLSRALHFIDFKCHCQYSDVIFFCWLSFRSLSYVFLNLVLIDLVCLVRSI